MRGEQFELIPQYELLVEEGQLLEASLQWSGGQGKLTKGESIGAGADVDDL